MLPKKRTIISAASVVARSVCIPQRHRDKSGAGGWLTYTHLWGEYLPGVLGMGGRQRWRCVWGEGESLGICF